jgi:hypothetical protein
MNRFMLFVTVTLLGVFLIMGQAFAAGEGATDTQTQSQTGTQSATPPMGSTESPMGTQASAQEFHRLSEFMDASVKGSTGEDLGSIDDIIISSDGKAEYVVLSKGGVMGVGGDLIPVPFDVAQPTKGPEGDITMNIDQQTLDQAPTVAENELQDTSMWEQEVRGYFGDSQMGQTGMQPSPDQPMQRSQEPGALGTQPGGQTQTTD